MPSKGVLLFAHLLLLVLLCVVSSIHWILLIISSIIYIILILKEHSNVYLLPSHHFASVIFALIHFGFTYSYAEILPWEMGLVFLFVLLIVHYGRRLHTSTTGTDFFWLPFGKQQQQLNDVVMTKFLLSNMFLFAYTCHLCLTTICTPEMYFNWFLIIHNCQYTYSTFHSSYTFAGGLLVSLTWAIVSVSYLVAYRLRY